jgi:hypothetical protein
VFCCNVPICLSFIQCKTHSHIRQLQFKEVRSLTIMTTSRLTGNTINNVLLCLDIKSTLSCGFQAVTSELNAKQGIRVRAQR